MVPSPPSDAWHAALASEPRRRVLALLTESAAPLDAVTVSAGIGLHVTTARFHLEQLEAAGLVERTVARVGQRGRPHVLFSPVEVSLVADPQRQLTQALAAVIGEDSDGGLARSVRAGERWSEQYPSAAVTTGAGATITPAVKAVAANAPATAAPAADAPADAPAAAPAPATTAPAAAAPDAAASDPAAPRGAAAPDAATPARGSVSDLVPPLLRVLDEIGFDPVLQPDSGTIALPSCPFRAEARQNPHVVCNVHLGLIRGLARSLGHDPEGIHLRPFVQPQLCLIDLHPLAS